MDIVLNYSDHVIVINDSKINFSGTPSDLFDGDVSQYSIDVPKLYQFCKLLKEHNVDIDIKSIKTIDDLFNQLRSKNG